jgi:hypothetical protein
MRKITLTMSKKALVAAITAILLFACFLSIQTATAKETITDSLYGKYLPTGQIGSASRQMTVTYDPNGGIGKANVVNVSPNTDHTIEDQNYERSGYGFGGWNSKPDGLGDLYFIGDVIRVTTSITLYALWLPNF